MTSSAYVVLVSGNAVGGDDDVQSYPCRLEVPEIRLYYSIEQSDCDKGCPCPRLSSESPSSEPLFGPQRRRGPIPEGKGQRIRRLWVVRIVVLTSPGRAEMEGKMLVKISRKYVL